MSGGGWVVLINPTLYDSEEEALARARQVCGREGLIYQVAQVMVTVEPTVKETDHRPEAPRGPNYANPVRNGINP